MILIHPQQLLDLTPKTHVDYLSTLCLLRSTDMMIKVMTEVKLREDEYEFVKTVIRRIQGLPDIAGRDRRLLHQGQIFHVTRRSRMPTASSPQVPDRSNRLVTAIHDWDVRRSRAGSFASTATGSSWEVPPTPTPVSSKIPSRLGASRFADEENETMVHVFVFSDVLVLASPLTGNDATVPEWSLYENGLARVMEFRHVSGGGLSFISVFDNASLTCLRQTYRWIYYR